MARRKRTAAALLVTGGILAAGALGPVAAADPVQLPSLGSAGLSIPGLGSLMPQPAATPRLASVANFRDVAGTDGGYVTTTGRHLQRGVFYRSNALTPDAADLKTLEGLHLRAIYDVRTDQEVAQAPDATLPGVKYVHIPILAGDLYAAAMAVRTPEEAMKFMQDMNRSFVTDAANRAGFEQLLTDLANTPGPQVFHCTSGKDRTGWASMLLQSVAGVPEATIMKDYLATNDYLAAQNAKTYQSLVASKGQAAADALKPMLGVDASFLQAGLDQIKTSYGTVDNYLTAGLGLDQSTLAKLRAKLVR
ncbi:tyrosine-protein phosphatase [Rhodococcus sp. D2-41]|nr:tyrosine-protein phosphatase [Rhodococcus sp. D2-41]